MRKIIFCANDAQKEQYHDFTEELEKRFSPVDISHHELPEKADIIVLGGDGSLNYMINNLPISGDYRIIYLPTGTANDFAKSLNQSHLGPKLEYIEEIIEQAPTIKIPLMKCNDRYFINIATGGAPALVTSDGENLLKKLTGKFDYYLKSLENIISPESFEVSYRIDDKSWEKVNLYGLSVAQGLYAGGGVKVANSAIPFFKEKFNFMAIKEGQISQALMDIIEMQKDTQNDYSDAVISHYPIKLELKSNQEIPFKLDGEPYQSTEIIFKKSQSHLNFYHF